MEEEYYLNISVIYKYNTTITPKNLLGEDIEWRVKYR